MKYRVISLVFCCAFLFGGCASIDSNIKPSLDLGSVKKAYIVKLDKDERGVHQLIVDHMHELGFDATSGDSNVPPESVDVVIAYEDRWTWDMTMYMLQLTVKVRDPDTGKLMATAKSYRPSLQRKSPEFMVKEVLDEIFNNN